MSDYDHKENNDNSKQQRRDGGIKAFRCTGRKRQATKLLVLTRNPPASHPASTPDQHPTGDPLSPSLATAQYPDVHLPNGLVAVSHDVPINLSMNMIRRNEGRVKEREEN